MLDTKVIQVTGRGTNVSLIIDDSASFESVIRELHEHLKQHRLLYSKGTITVNVGKRLLAREELTQIKQILEKESGVTVSRFWCPPHLLEEALSQSVGFGVSVSPTEGPASSDIAGSQTRQARKAARPEPASENPGLEQWIAYVLDRPSARDSRPAAHAGPVELTVVPEEGGNQSRGPEAETAALERADSPVAESTAPPVAAGPAPEAETEEPEAVPTPTAEITVAEPAAGPAREAEDDIEAAGPVEEPPVTETPGAVQQPEAAEQSTSEPAATKKQVRPAPAGRVDSQRETAGLHRNNETLLIKTTCRSGEVIRYPGDVVVMADVNPGAEVIADGDILIFGSLRGLAHAGASGDIQATIIALSLDTHRLQIGPYTGVAPKSNQRSKSNKSDPRIAFVRRRSVYVAPYAGRFAGYSGGTLYDG